MADNDYIKAVAYMYNDGRVFVELFRIAFI